MSFDAILEIRKRQSLNYVSNKKYLQVSSIIRSESKNTIYEAFIKGYSKSTGIDPKTKKSLKGLEGGLY